MTNNSDEVVSDSKSVAKENQAGENDNWFLHTTREQRALAIFAGHKISPLYKLHGIPYDIIEELKKGEAKA
jgi:hypothetical protein